MASLSTPLPPLARAGAVETGVQPAVAPSPVLSDQDSLAVRIEAFTDLSAAEGLWRALEAEGHGSVYQRFDWCRTWVESFGITAPLILVGMQRNEPLILLPLHVETLPGGLRTARFMGGAHGNIRLPLTSATPRHRALLADWIGSGRFLSACTARLRAMGAADRLAFECMPVRFAGIDNLLAAHGGHACGDAVFAAPLGPDFATLARERRGKAYLKKIRSKMRAIEQAGPLAFTPARTPAEAEAALELFFAQKKARFDALRFVNRFDQAPDRAFLTALARRSAETGDGTLDVYTLAAGPHPLAVFAVGRHGPAVSGAVHSMTCDPVLAHRSPGDIMLHALIEHLCGERVGHFDLGFGDSAYKQGWCDTVPLRSVDSAVTPRGHLLRAADRVLSLARRLVLGHPAVALRARQARWLVRRALSR